MLSDLEIHYLRQMRNARELPNKPTEKTVKYYVNDEKHISYCFRKIVMNDILRFKHSEFTSCGGHIICPVAKTKVEFSECDIDHTFPNLFTTILHQYFVEFNIPKMSCIGVEVVDLWRRHAEDFKAFHNEYAALCAVHQDTNRLILPAYIKTLQEHGLTEKYKIDTEQFYAAAREWWQQKANQQP